MRLLIPVLFWVGLFGTVWELLYARKHGVPVTTGEKLYLALVVPLIFLVALTLAMLDVPRAVTSTASALAIGMAFTGWAFKRRVQRRAAAASSGQRVEPQ
jgi:hypothetical protein